MQRPRPLLPLAPRATRWWRSFLSSGSAGLYLFLYSIWYFVSKLEITGLVSSAVRDDDAWARRG